MLANAPKAHNNTILITPQSEIIAALARLVST